MTWGWFCAGPLLARILKKCGRTERCWQNATTSHLRFDARFVGDRKVYRPRDEAHRVCFMVQCNAFVSSESAEMVISGLKTTEVNWPAPFVSSTMTPSATS